MEILLAILIYFNMMSYESAGLTPAQVDLMLSNNPSTVEFYTNNPAELSLVASRVPIDRAED